MSGPDLGDLHKATAMADDAIYARGRADERAAIVAWLKTGTAVTDWKYVARLIEIEGDHLKGEKNGE